MESICLLRKQAGTKNVGINRNGNVPIVRLGTSASQSSWHYPASAVTVGSTSAMTSTTSTSLTVAAGGFSIGDPCGEIFYNGVSSTSLVSFDSNITAVGNGTATATTIFFNAANSTTTFTVTSTAGV
jgi:hypothetical protein